MPLIPIEQFGLQLQQSGEISGELPFQKVGTMFFRARPKDNILENGIAALPNPLAGPRYLEGRKWLQCGQPGDRYYQSMGVQAPSRPAVSVLRELKSRMCEVGPSVDNPFVNYGSGYRLCFWQLTPMGDGIEWTAEEQQPDPPKQVEWGGRLEHEDGSGQWQPITTPPFSVEVYFEFTFHWPPLDLEAAGGQVLPAHQPQAREPGKHVQLLGRPRFQPFRTSESQHFILELSNLFAPRA
ncbi:hypothetical protein C6P46_000332 [Rhodotorula mucilaginosa]|uniref:Uncharacterized protein n=1 Tax=Rhodotorula mucilaginosa TaxID=5537 RepID=A0A9P7B3H4_RHOMI|nr:hypothetical protein C6P46_000332 [Rhodotorula mucilaginosa]